MRSTVTMKALLTNLLLIATNTLALDCAATELEVGASQPVSEAPSRCATFADSGLTWELKTDDGGIHDKDNIYRWGGIGAEKTGKIFFDDWNDLLNATNGEKLCGFDDWRVPTIDELKTLVTTTGASTTGKSPMIDTSVFPLTLAMPYWSVSTYQHYPEHAQTVDFATGTSNYYTGFRGDRLPLRLVRSE